MSQFDLKKFLVENKLTSNSRRMVNERAFAPEYDQYGDGPDPLDKFLDAAADSSVFNQRLIDDIQALLDRAHSNGKLDLRANPEQEIVQVLVDLWEGGRLPHTISDYIHPEVLIRDYGFSQEELDSDREEYFNTQDYQPLDEFFYYDEKDVKHTPDQNSGSEVGRFRSFLRQIKTSDVDLASYLGVSVAELYDILDRDGVDAIMDAYDTAQDKNADFIPESFQKKRK